MTDYVDRCTCGNFVTQEELDKGYCPECERYIGNLSDQWEEYENLQIEQPETLGANQEERGTGRFDKELYEATKQAMLVAGAPEEVAEKAAKVIAGDDSSKPNLGRSEVDQKIVSQAWNYLVKPKS